MSNINISLSIPCLLFVFSVYVCLIFPHFICSLRHKWGYIFYPPLCLSCAGSCNGEKTFPPNEQQEAVHFQWCWLLQQQEDEVPEDEGRGDKTPFPPHGNKVKPELQSSIYDSSLRHWSEVLVCICGSFICVSFLFHGLPLRNNC